MADEIKNIVKVACIYATSIIGAGFATGQEIMQFFSVYKTGGFYGILLAGLLFSVVGSIVLGSVYNGRIRNYEEFIFPVFGWLIGWIIEITVTLFMLCLFCVMIAGSGSVLSDRIGIPPEFAVPLMGLISMLFIFTNIKGVVTLSTLVTPILIIGIILASLAIIFFGVTEVFSISGYLKTITGNWLFSSLLYVSYNSLLSIVIMCSLLPYLKTKRIARMGGVLGGIVLCFAALVVNAVVFLFYPVAFEMEMPIFAILKGFSSSAGNLYAVILWLAMLTSAVTSGFCLTDRVGTMLKLDRKFIVPILCIASVPLSMMGFSKLITTLYPIFGYLGIFIVFTIIINGLVRLQNSKSGKCGRK